MNSIPAKRSRRLFGRNKKSVPLESLTENFYYQEIAELTAAGGWYVNFVEKASFLDPAARRILNTPADYKVSLYALIEFYPEGPHREKAIETFLSCSEGIPFNTTVKMITYDGKEFWVRASGRPIYDDKQVIIGLQGVFQDINEEKLKELSLEKSIRVIESQNSKLLNFAHIVSHNLRSHASNLQLTLELLKTMKSNGECSEETELKASLHEISTSLNETIIHLNEIVSIQNSASSAKTMVSFQSVYARVCHALSYAIHTTDTEILDDFSEFPEIEYIEAYLESIIINLLSNAIKYRHPERNPEIQIGTFLEDGKPCLMVRDNGLGIDLALFGNKIFNIYQTFHHNQDAVGVGLFMTKNQVEALGGSISVRSEVGVGTTFKIVL